MAASFYTDRSAIEIQFTLISKSQKEKIQTYLNKNCKHKIETQELVFVVFTVISVKSGTEKWNNLY